MNYKISQITLNAIIILLIMLINLSAAGNNAIRNEISQNTKMLLGIQDADLVVGNLLFDLANKGDDFEGMRRKIQCKVEEIIIRDEETIIASLFQGPDKKTMINKETKNIVFYLFGVPEIKAESFKNCVKRINEIYKDSFEKLDYQLI